MKHTYLYPLPANARFLWNLARANASDLFGYPDGNHKAGWLTTIRLDDVFGHAREVVYRMIDDAPRVCIGEGYVIPDSLTEDGGRHHAVHESTAILTRRLWDAPEVTEGLYSYLMTFIGARPDGDVPGRDPANEIHAFLRAHMGQTIIPVWM